MYRRKHGNIFLNSYLNKGIKYFLVTKSNLFVLVTCSCRGKIKKNVHLFISIATLNCPI